MKLASSTYLKEKNIMNDISMFQIADEAYAVENAVEELKELATGVIGDNNSDSVAHWLERTQQF